MPIDRVLRLKFAQRASSLLLITYACIVASTTMVWAGPPAAGGKNDLKGDAPELNALLEKVEQRYAGPGFSARFDQQSTIAAMEITDTAAGNLFVKRPGKMRWEYTQPEPQIIISDGDDLWIYRKEDNQVMIGKAPSFFADGKGAGFLSDLKTLRKEFNLKLQPPDAQGNPIIKLIPKNQSADLSHIQMTISKDKATIDQIVTLNGYGDETQIQIKQYRFNQDLADDIFLFKIPDGAEVLQMDSP